MRVVRDFLASSADRSFGSSRALVETFVRRPLPRILERKLWGTVSRTFASTFTMESAVPKDPESTVCVWNTERIFESICFRRNGLVFLNFDESAVFWSLVDNEIQN